MRILCLRLQPRDRRDKQPELDRPRLAADLEEFSPRIGWCDRSSCVCLDVTSTSRWFGGESRLLVRVREWCEERRLAGRAAIADTLGAAWAVVHFGIDCAGTFATQVVPIDQATAALADLPIEGLRLTRDTEQVLHELGVDIIDRLLALPRDEIAERFEPDLLLRIDQAVGAVPEPYAAYRREPEVKIEQSWEFGISDAESVIYAWERLLPRLLPQLSERGRGVARLLAELIGESGAVCRLVVGLLRPTLDRRHLLGLLRLRLESVRLCEPVTGTRLAVLEDASLAVQQQVLFRELSPPVESAEWASLVERLAGRLGPDHVVRIRSHPDHEPERAWKAAPWIRRTPRRPRGRETATLTQPLPPRPTWLLPQPRVIQVLAIAPQGHPQRFYDRNHESRVTQSWGPERIETGWWRGPSLRRDYYRVATDTGAQAWLYRELRTRRWYLHGWFD